ncbi:hypothetical protein ZIOFF_046940 [Zingiber officinale]|uniref:X8 domain-containing protein n=1 Tax=Zingiber officinale TaxID=94328 RepID=A0A8J5FQR9_ZINOF|nr:hypothetical protein ZIOFF_046940 [Zingiber officinale]
MLDSTLAVGADFKLETNRTLTGLEFVLAVMLIIGLDPAFSLNLALDLDETMSDTEIISELQSSDISDTKHEFCLCCLLFRVRFFLINIVLASGNGPWCILNLGVPEEAQQANIQYSCGGGIADCSAMQEGGPCWSPDIGRMAAYAMNAYYYAAGHKDINCDFKGTGTIITFDPSDAKCDYPS